jgi:hypothetical protein
MAGPFETAPDPIIVVMSPWRTRNAPITKGDTGSSLGERRPLEPKAVIGGLRLRAATVQLVASCWPLLGRLNQGLVTSTIGAVSHLASLRPRERPRRALNREVAITSG